MILYLACVVDVKLNQALKTEISSTNENIVYCASVTIDGRNGLDHW